MIAGTLQDNVILLSLKAMLAEFAFFMMLATVCFSGFLYTFWSLSGPQWTVGKIVWLMTKVWLGNSYVLFDTAQEFSPIYGPPLMVFFAVMANTLLLTILISLLSNTFSMVAQNAVEEAMYQVSTKSDECLTTKNLLQFACKTVSGISSEALMSYMPPLNLLALLFVGPASFVLSPRYLHKANVYLLRATSWPILLLIRFGSYNWTGNLRSTSTVQFGSATPDRFSITSYLLSTSSTERASHFISWLPLPRSRGSPDRDIIEAAFLRSMDTNEPVSHESHSHLDSVTQSAGEHISSDVRNSSSGMPKPSTSGEQKEQGNCDVVQPDSSIMQTPSRAVRNQMPSTRTAYESPLAKLFSRAWGSTAESRNPVQGAVPAEDVRGPVTGILIDTDASDADQEHAAGPGSGTANSRTERDGNEDEPSFGEGIDEQATTHGLMLELAKRMDAQEEAQQRMEEAHRRIETLLLKLVDNEKK